MKLPITYATTFGIAALSAAASVASGAEDSTPGEIPEIPSSDNAPPSDTMDSTGTGGTGDSSFMDFGFGEDKDEENTEGTTNEFGFGYPTEEETNSPAADTSMSGCCTKKMSTMGCPAGLNEDIMSVTIETDGGGVGDLCCPPDTTHSGGSSPSCDGFVVEAKTQGASSSSGSDKDDGYLYDDVNTDSASAIHKLGEVYVVLGLIWTIGAVVMM